MTHAHAIKDMRATFEEVLKTLAADKPNERDMKRSERCKYSIPDWLTKGAGMMGKEWAAPRGAPGEADEEDVEAEVEERHVELTEEDLSVEGMI